METFGSTVMALKIEHIPFARSSKLESDAMEPKMELRAAAEVLLRKILLAPFGWEATQLLSDGGLEH
jgi:hypothetical protein